MLLLCALAKAGIVGHRRAKWAEVREVMMRRGGMLVAIVRSLLVVAILPVALLTMLVDWRVVLQAGVERDSETGWTGRVHAGDDTFVLVLDAW